MPFDVDNSLAQDMEMCFMEEWPGNPALSISGVQPSDTASAVRAFLEGREEQLQGVQPQRRRPKCQQ